LFRNRLHHFRRAGAAVLIIFFFLGLAALPLEAKKVPKAPASAESTNFTFDTNAYNADMVTDRRGEGGSVILSLLSSLVIIAVIAVGLYYFLKFIARKQNQGNVNRDIIRVIAQNSVAVGKYLTVVKILNTYYILGLAEGGVTLIREVTDRTEIDRLRELETQMPLPGAGAASFQDYLKDVFSRLKKPDKSPGAKATPDRILGFLNTQKERLKRMNGRDNGSEKKENSDGGRS
jgi:flagellar biogenesis protein FliO